MIPADQAGFRNRFQMTRTPLGRTLKGAAPGFRSLGVAILFAMSTNAGANIPEMAKGVIPTAQSISSEKNTVVGYRLTSSSETQWRFGRWGHHKSSVTCSTTVNLNSDDAGRWTAERCRCNDHTNMFRARLGPDRSLETLCVETVSSGP